MEEKKATSSCEKADSDAWSGEPKGNLTSGEEEKHPRKKD